MKVISSGVVAGIATAALVSLAPGAHAEAGQTVMIRPGDFLSALSDTRSAGHVDFLKEGLHVYTDDSSSNAKAAEYVAVTPQSLPDSASLTWWGTQPQPGTQLVFDADGDSTTTDDSWNVLVGEPTYGDDYWMTSSSSFYKTHHDLCPETSGGSGSDCHGTLAEWQGVLPDAKVYAAGFSLGSGIKGDGVIHDLQVGTTDYQFTDEPAITTVPVTGQATVKKVYFRYATVLKLTFATDELGPNQAEGKKLTFKVTEDGAVVDRTKMGAGEEGFERLRYALGTGKHVIDIYKNGELDQEVVLHMGS